MKISLCIATYNEEKNIHYPLDSAYDFVDEVVVVDGGSTDKTIEIAKLYGKKVKVYSEDNPPMFHINKQKAIERAKGEWILQLDADEAISDELKKEIKSVVSNQSSVISKKQNGIKLTTDNRQPITAFWIPRKNFFLARFLMKGGQYPDYTIRLYRSGFARFPCKSVHENVEIASTVISNEVRDLATERSVKNKDHASLDFSALPRNDISFIGYLKNPILHYADPDFSRYLKRWDRYTTLEASELTKTFHVSRFTFHTVTIFDYFIIKPSLWFISTYIRHLGFLDGFPGFVFALFSSIRFWVIYIKVWKRTNSNNS